ncbi:hypothetical protein KASHIRA_02410 [Serratia phage vB_SmaM-Kashira]|nr:hypothetical protein KASHIRA_02410 [Serratia phage vB_SmaM-Kashira]
MSKINKREASFLQAAVVFGWEIEASPRRKTQYWDGDCLLPVKIGKVAEGLISKGYLEEVGKGGHSGFWIIRATKKAKAHVCRGNGCHQGFFYDESDMKVGPCQTCGGVGVVLEVNNG